MTLIIWYFVKPLKNINSHDSIGLVKLKFLPQRNLTFNAYHYDDVIMSTITSQITSLTIVYSTIYSGADQSKHQSSASLAFVWGIHRGPVNSPHKWPVTRKMFPFDEVIISADTVFKYIIQLEGNKAVGHDGLSWKFIKLSGKLLAMPLCELFNRCVVSSEFPVDMKLAEISPVFPKKMKVYLKNILDLWMYS